MATYTVTDERDGKSYEISAPDDATMEQVAAQARKQFAEQQRVKTDFFESPEQAARAKAADERVALERAEQGPGRTGVRDALRSATEWTPVGSWLDEANSGLSAAANKVSGGRVGEPYQDRMDYHAAYDRAKEADSTVLGSVPILGEFNTQTIPRAIGGIMSAPFAPAARPLQGVSMLPKVGNAAVTGGLYGGAYGAGQGQGTERAVNAGFGAAAGFGFGAAAVPIASGAGYAVNKAAGKVMGLPPELQGIDPRAARLVSEDMQSAGLTDPSAPNGYAQQAARLGPEGTLMDMGRKMQTGAMGVAAAEGRGGQQIADTLEFRRRGTSIDGGATRRINDALDQGLGAPVNTVDFERNLRRQYGPQAQPFYDDFYSRNIPITSTIRGLLRRAQATGAIRRAQTLMEAEGLDPRRLSSMVDNEMTPLTGQQTRVSERVPNGVEFDYIKRGIDDAARNAAPGSNEQRVMSELARRLRNEVDEILSPGAPDQSPWAQGRAIAAEEHGIRDAMDVGGRVFKKGTRLTPDQLAAEMQGMSAMEREAVMMSARQSLRGQMGDAAAGYGATPDLAGRRALNSIDAREKLAMVAGRREGEGIARRIDTENTFANTEQRVLHNSATAERQEALRRYKPTTGDATNSSGSDLRSVSLTGLAASSAAKVVNALMKGAIDERRARTLLDSGRLFSAQGATRDQYARGLIELARRRGVNEAQMRRVEAFAQRVIESGRTSAVEKATSP